MKKVNVLMNYGGGWQWQEFDGDWFQALPEGVLEITKDQNPVAIIAPRCWIAAKIGESS